MLSVIGFGGIILKNRTQSAANDLVARAVERGVNYFDVAPSYGDAEVRLGPALAPYRQSVFLACKTMCHTRREVAIERRRSLRKLRTDHLDLYQLHGIKSLAEVDEITAPGGALEAFLEAREQGLVRYLGFSAHDEEAALTLLGRFAFDTVLFPCNWVCWYQGHFGPRLVARAHGEGVGLLGIKALARRGLTEGEERTHANCWYVLAETPVEAEMALRFALTRPLTAAVSPGDDERLWWMCDAAERFRPLTAEEETALARADEGLAPLFKTAEAL